MKSALLVLLVPVVTFSAEPDCGSPKTTLEMNLCASREAGQAEAGLRRYLEASRARVQDDAQALAALDAAQLAWEAYRDRHCTAVYELWRQGSIRGVMGAGCRLRLTRQRAHQLWTDYLTYPDGTPPILPEPVKD